MSTFQIVVEMALVLFVTLSLCYIGTFLVRYFQNREEIVYPYGKTAFLRADPLAVDPLGKTAKQTVRLAARKLQPSWLEKRWDEELSSSDPDFLRVLDLESRVAYIWATTDQESPEESLERDFYDKF